MFDRVKLARRYYELCDRRDAAYRACEPAEVELAAVNARIQADQAKAAELAEQIEQTWAAASDDGTKEGWLKLKKEIADIARFFGRVPPRPEPVA